MIIAEFTTAQLAWMSARNGSHGFNLRMSEGVEYRGMTMMEITSEERQAFTCAAHNVMNAHDWLSSVYVMAESITQALYVTCAD